MKIDYSKNHYGTLGVEKTATTAAIRLAYRKMAAKCHPDVKPGDAESEELFKKINEAHEVLSSPELRSRYDSGDVDFSQGWGPAYTGSSHRRQQVANTDVEIVAVVTAFESLSPINYTASFTRSVYCGDCQGKGTKGDSSRGVTCPDCQGSGIRRTTQSLGVMSFSTDSPCQRCCQRGFLFTEVCGVCGGWGFRDEAAEMKIMLPLGCVGKRLAVSEAGNRQHPSQRPGHLIIQTLLHPDPSFDFSQDYSAFTKVRVSPVEAILGATLTLNAIDGSEVTVNLPPGASSGHREVIHGMGLFSDENSRGPMVIQVDHEMPTSSTPEEAEALRHYLRLRAGQPEPSDEKENDTAESAEGTKS
jgi:molecular chaperone DnaJ